LSNLAAEYVQFNTLLQTTCEMYTIGFDIDSVKQPQISNRQTLLLDRLLLKVLITWFARTKVWNSKWTRLCQWNSVQKPIHCATQVH